MAKEFTTNELQNISNVYKNQYGGDIDKFKTAINTQYGEGAFDKVKGAIQTSANNINQSNQFNVNQQNQQSLEQKIKSGNFTAKEAAEYNRLTGNKSGARNLALTSQPAVQGGNLKTSITQDEGQMMKDAGITKVNQNITAEQSPKIETPTEAKPGEVPSVETPKYEQQLDKALETSDINTVRNKLKEGLANGTIDQNTYNQSEAYLWNKINQQNQAVTNSDSILNTMLSGGQIDDSIKGTDAYKKAMSSYATISQLQNASGKQIFDSVNAGIISEGSPEFIKLSQLNPQGIEAFKQYKENQRISGQVNSLNTSYYDSLNSVDNYDKNKSVSSQSREPSTPTDILQIMSDMVTKSVAPDYAELWREKISENPEANTLSNQISDYNTRLQELSQEKINKEDEIKAQLSGTGATQDYIDAKVRAQLKDIYKEENNINISLANAQSKLNYITENAKTELDLMQKQYEAEQQQLGNKLSVAQMGLNYATNEQNYQRSLEAEQRQRDFTVQQTQAQQAFDLYKTKLDQQYQDSRDVANYQRDLEKMGIQNKYSIDMNNLNFEQQKQLAEIENKYATSRDVQNYNQALSQMAYQTGLNTQSDIAKMTAEYNLANQTTPVTSGVLATEKINGKKVTMDTNALASFKNAISQMPGTVIGAQQYRTKEEQAELVKKGVSWTMDSKHMQGLAVDIYANNKLEKPTAEQIKIMNENGWYQPAETMAKGDYGHFEYKGTGGQYTDNDIALLSSVTKLDKQGKETLKNNGYTEKEWANFNAGLLPPTQSQKLQTQEVLDLITSLENSPGLNNAVGYKGPIGSFTTIAGTDKADFEALFNTFKDTLALTNIEKMKGAMSDKDIEFLRNTAGAINLDMSEKAFKDSLTKLKQKYTNMLNKGKNTQTETNQVKLKSGNTYNFSNDLDIIKYLQSKKQ